MAAVERDAVINFARQRAATAAKGPGSREPGSVDLWLAASMPLSAHVYLFLCVEEWRGGRSGGAGGSKPTGR